MTDEISSSVTAIIPCNDLDAAEAWWARLGFSCPEGHDFGDYRMLSDSHGAQVHLQRAVEGWVVPGRNPFAVYLYTPGVDALAEIVHDEIAGAAKAPEHKPWGMYEFALNGPDDLLVRIGWPSRLQQKT
jgi:hypothetical protein